MGGKEIGRKKESKQKVKDYIESVRIDKEIQYLTHKYHTAYKWLPRLEIEAPGLAPQEALQQLRDRLSELREKQKHYDKARISQMKKKAKSERVPEDSSFAYSLPSGRVVYSSMPHTFSYGMAAEAVKAEFMRPFMDPSLSRVGSWVGSSVLHRKRRLEPEPQRVDGMATASRFGSYVFGPYRDSTYACRIELPVGTHSLDDFSGAYGVQFEYRIEETGFRFPCDDYDTVWYDAILQYDLPEVTFDQAYVCVFVGMSFYIDDMIIDADWGEVDISAIRELDLLGEDLPQTASEVPWGFGTDVCRVEGGDHIRTGPVSVTAWSRHHMHYVPLGVKPRMNVGHCAWLWAADGTAKLSRRLNSVLNCVTYTYKEEEIGSPAQEETFPEHP